MTIDFAPFADWIITLTLLSLFGLGGVLLLLRQPTGWLWRLSAIIALSILLLNPQIITEHREPAQDVAVVVIDKTASQVAASRVNLADQAANAVQEKLKTAENLDIRTVTLDDTAGKTSLFKAIEDATSDVPRAHLAGSILITDGQIHDVPKAEDLNKRGPIHAILTGEKNRSDRRLKIVQKPAFGLVGKQIDLTIRIDDMGVPETQRANYTSLTLRYNGIEQETKTIQTGKDITFPITLDHAGKNIIELSSTQIENEISTVNNQAVAVINGVRDRLKVLLVSGQPHMGERVWRNLLKSDAGVDLVHFTILRTRTSENNVPSSQLALIPFPVHQLFETNLYDFDLIILDRYQKRGLIYDRYLQNIADYVKQGGALLTSVGPEYADDKATLFNSALSDIIPAAPNGIVLDNTGKPQTTKSGDLHPVTSSLRTSRWSAWHRHLGLERIQGDVLLESAQGDPLLILNRVEKGRSALLASDHIWLWARGYNGGGPHTAMLRRLAHWLMKEPSLEENRIDAHASGRSIDLKIHLSEDFPEIDIKQTMPDGTIQTHPVSQNDQGSFTARLENQPYGVHYFEAGTARGYTIIGDTTSKEFQSLHTSDDLIKEAVKSTGGAIHWWNDKSDTPNIKQRSKNAHNFGGKNWIGLRRGGGYTVTGVEKRPLIDPWLALLAMIALIGTAWWREGKG